MRMMNIDMMSIISDSVTKTELRTTAFIKNLTVKSQHIKSLIIIVIFCY